MSRIHTIALIAYAFDQECIANVQCISFIAFESAVAVLAIVTSIVKYLIQLANQKHLTLVEMLQLPRLLK